ncbi:PTS lactose/cellobiose transporter subunit IIA [Alkalicella caledoniensis]|uniref:PTS lactose/cellobiose transporter subunit IIA n=1 Tax=Alkalicella caledoniensis TaxID=2731377 RepID=A0A7G9W5U6_ALKCA|nr:PTS lactose/cellobiose transporter subunit IIA [Alkalicella caledoniensis]QNO14058.1 PTS lactose/cellobiose transporter subunit IIA [Alkalicella caledoniensis]
MEGMELISFQIVSAAGAAKSYYMEAITAAKSRDFEKADKIMAEGLQIFQDAHKAHASLIQKEASGEKIEFNLLFMHAEDQLMTTDLLKLMAHEIIDLYRAQGGNTVEN